ncbi:MAG TPA: hypothetical protein VMU95_08405 [Trebonia sp.]|nr:hypothetical protein [Trebonia sp.]
MTDAYTTSQDGAAELPAEQDAEQIQVSKLDRLETTGLIAAL